MPRTKIVCTIGPASESEAMLRQLIEGGMSVARLNFSHGTHAEHLRKIEIIRRLSMEMDRPVAVLQDLCGPKIRVGSIPEPGMELKPGQELVLTIDPSDGSDGRVFVSYPGLPEDVREHDRILLADGLIELEVRKVAPPDIHCEVLNGGVLTSNKGLNLPTGTVKTEALTPKDREDLLFGIQNDVDYVAMSFVRSAADILQVKEIIQSAGKDIPVVAKIEKHEALDEIDEIVRVSDAIMIARGDLGVEIPLENVPRIQKMLIRKANAAGKAVIIATQMLRSMVDSPRPTRAEATDVANGVLDGADAVMLSEETATGNYPAEATRYLAKIAASAEAEYPHQKYLNFLPKAGVEANVAHASCILAEHLGVAAIIATTKSGFTAKNISRFRPRTQIIALSPEESTVRRLALYWGCTPAQVPRMRDTDEMFANAVVVAKAAGLVKQDDLVVITAGHPLWEEGTTNMLKAMAV